MVEKFAIMKICCTFAHRKDETIYQKQLGRLAQLVQSICLTSRGSAVRIRQRPHNKRSSPRNWVAPIFVQIMKYIYDVTLLTNWVQAYYCREYINIYLCDNI